MENESSPSKGLTVVEGQLMVPEDNSKIKLESKQLELFRTLFGATVDDNSLSNFILIWDAIPKYSVSKQMQASMRDEHGRLPVFIKELELPTGESCKLTMKPASIKGKDGVTRDHYPSDTESLIEDVLRKIFLNDSSGEHLVKKDESSSWVRFTLRMIHSELKRHKKGRTMDEVKDGLTIMNEANIEVSLNGKLAYKGGILPEQFFKDRSEYLLDPNAPSLVRFSSLVSQGIDNYGFRQYNYARVMKHKSPVARWLHKRLATVFINAGYEPTHNFYSLSYSRADTESGMFHHSKKTRRIDTLRKAIEELVKDDVLDHFDESISKVHGSNEIQDVDFKLYPSKTFVKEMKASNKRHQKLNAAIHRNQMGIGRSNKRIG